MKRIVSLVLCLTLLSMTIFVGTAGSVSADTQPLSLTQEGNLEEVKERISVVDNQYVLNLSRENNLLTKDEYDALQNHLEVVNALIGEYKITDVSVENGFSLQISDAEMRAVAEKLVLNSDDSQLHNLVLSEEWGRTSSYEESWGLNVYWWGVEVWLPKWFVEMSMYCATAAAAVLVNTLPLAGQLVGAVVIAAALYAGTQFVQPLIIGMFWTGVTAYVVVQTPAHTPPPPGGGTPPILVP